MKIRNVSPLGDVHVLGRIVAAGEEFEVADAAAEQLLAQPANFEAAKAPTPEPKEARK